MGTSVNQGSPKTAGWTSVSRCYTDPRVPVAQTTAEIWRAAINQGPSLTSQLNSKLVEHCLEIGKSKPARSEIMAQVKSLNNLKDNTIVGEFAKRALISTAIGGYNESVATNLFKQLTDYYVARDIPGYVGSDYRCKTVSELRDFKSQLTSSVSAKVKTLEQKAIASKQNWSQTVTTILEGLKRP
jgi:hypothetical protein